MLVTMVTETESVPLLWSLISVQYNPSPLLPGTYNAHRGAEDITSCELCSAGKYCSGTGKTADGSDCDAGKLKNKN